jgi:PhnB protein
MVEPSITPMLTVVDAVGAIDFYHRAFGALEISRLTTPGGQIVAELMIHGARFGIVDENPAGFNLSPRSLGGTSVRVSLIVDDPDAVTRQAIDAGAIEVFPLADQPYGMRQGRVEDPYGHHWLIGRPLPAAQG